MPETMNSDVLIVGGGGAGARAAVEASDDGASVVLALKGYLGSSGATTYGVAEMAGFNVADGGVEPLDNPDVHYQDILTAGLGMCDEKLARILVDEAYPRMKDLENWGVRFEKDNSKYVEIKACFSSYPRTHVIKGFGIPIIKALGRQIGRRDVRVVENVMISNLLIEDGRCVGAMGVDKKGSFIIFNAKSTILATGGAGRLFRFNLNPKDITGDGYAMAYRAGAELINMEFMQAGIGTIYPTENLLSAWLWSLKPKLKNKDGQEFLRGYVPPDLIEKCYQEKSEHFPFSTRDSSKHIEIGIQEEIKEGRVKDKGGIWLDFTHVDETFLKKFPKKSDIRKMWNLTRDWFRNRGADLRKHPIQVVIHAHAMNGGLRVSEEARSTIRGLYAAGETAGGPHGADRLGGNMMVTCQVFGTRAGKYAAQNAKCTRDRKISKKLIAEEKHRILRIFGTEGTRAASALKKQIQHIMWQNVLVVRNEQSLRNCRDELHEIRKEFEGNLKPDREKILEALEVENLLEVAEIIVSAALIRQESRGSHYREDHPRVDNVNWNRVISIRPSGKEMKLHLIDLPRLVSSSSPPIKSSKPD